MDRIDYQHKIIETLDDAIAELPAEEFERLIRSIERDLEEYKD